MTAVPGATAGSTNSLADRDVVCFLDRDHVLDVAMAMVSGPPSAARLTLERFVHPEVVDAAAIVRATAVPDCTVVEPPQTYGSVARPPLDTTVLVVRRSPVPAELMASLPRLRHVQKLGERTDTVDVDYAKSRGITLNFVPRPSLESTADHAILLMLAMLRRLLALDRQARTVLARKSGTSATTSYNWAFIDRLATLSGRTLGIVGLGEVGLLVARRAQAFGARIVYTSHDPVSPAVECGLGLHRVGLDDLLAASDVVSLHVPATPGNHRLVDGGFLRRMKPGAMLVNVARGELVDESALVAALRSGRLAAAGLDVHTHEPRHPEDPLLTMDEVILTPHVAGGLRSHAVTEIVAMVDGICRRNRGPVGNSGGEAR